MARRSDALAIFDHALDACRVGPVLEERVRREGPLLAIRHPMRPEAAGFDLRRFDDVLLIAFGKAAVPMTGSLLGILGGDLPVHGLCAAPRRPPVPDPRIRWYAAGHPVPNGDSFRAARSAIALLRSAGPRTLVLFLVSGGGSTLFELPLDPRIGLDDAVAFHRALLASGAPITEVNALRKHFSAVKGGRLAALAPHAARHALLVLDVPAGHPDALASGPTLPDSTTVAGCRAILEQYRLAEAFPPLVRQFFADPHLPETPGDKTAASPALPADHTPLLSNLDLVEAARQKALALGYPVEIENGCDDWPVERAADYLLGRTGAGPRCLLSGGEVTVRLPAVHGTGGRNQQFALAAALRLASGPASGPVCLSAASDGVDGNSPAAGALADPETASRARALGLDPQTALAAFDAFPLFSRLGDAIVTGPTGNNLRDLRVLLCG